MEREEKEKATPEISIRRFELSDVDDYMVWASDDEVSKFCSWDTYTNKEDLLKYMKETVLSHPWFRAICVAGRPVGAISVSLGSGNERCRGELGYVLGSRHWGKGIVTAAVRLVVGSIFNEVEGLERVDALVDVDNKASQRVLEKAGFHKEGLLRSYMIQKGRKRDMVMYSFISTDPLVFG